RALVPEAGADLLEDARHGLEVVREHLRARVVHLVEELGDRVEVRDEQLDARARVERVDLADRLRVEPGAAVGPVVARDARDGGVAQAHRLDGLRDAARLVGVEVGRLARVDLAEVAPPRALVAADEERRLAVLPALEDVGTARLLADRVQTLALHESLELGVLRAHGRASLDPLGLLLDRRRGVAGLDPQHAPSFWCDRHGCLPVVVASESRRRRAGGWAAHPWVRAPGYDAGLRSDYAVAVDLWT